MSQYGDPVTLTSENAEPGVVRLSVQGLANDDAFEGISFDLRAGEILGFGGLVGSGRTEIARVLFGIDHPTAGSIRIDGEAVTLRSTKAAMDSGIASVSEDRMGQSLILDEPTQGIDIQTKANVHTMIAELAAQGLAIILISSEIPELLGMCDRMIVLREGAITAELTRGEANQEKVMRAATAAIVARSAAEMNPPRPSDPADVPAGPASKQTNPFIRLSAPRELGLVAAIAAVVLPIMLINPRMLSEANLTALSMDAALLLIVAVAQMLVIITRSIDLSVASVIGLAAYGAASTLHAHPEIGVGGALVLACGIGLACGLINGLVVTKGRVPAIVATLGTMSVFRGLNSLWAGGKQISADQVPQAWLDLTSASVLGVPAVVLIALATLLLVGFALRSLPAAMEQAGLLGKIKLTGLAPATLIKKYIQGGTVQDIWWNVKDLGYLTYYAAHAVAMGKVTGKEGETFKAGRLGDYTVGAGGEVVLGPHAFTPRSVKDNRPYRTAGPVPLVGELILKRPENGGRLGITAVTRGLAKDNRRLSSPGCFSAARRLFGC